MLKDKILIGCFIIFGLAAIGKVAGQTKNFTTAEYIETYKNVAQQEMKLYKIPASITLAQGILESDNGNSTLARNANNHFGIKCKEEWTGEKLYHDDDEKAECFRKYKSAWESYRDHSHFLTQRERYAFLFKLEITDYMGWAKGLKQAGYATSPTYAEVLIKIIETNKLYLFDKFDQDIQANIQKDTIIAKNVFTSDSSGNKIMDSIRLLSNNDIDFQDVVFSENSRRIGQINEVRFIYARKGDSYNSIAIDFGLVAKDISLYNDQKKDHQTVSGEVVFIEYKKETGSVEYHTVLAGETMLGISQLYGIKLRSLYLKNRMKQGTEVNVGQKLYLQKFAPFIKKGCHIK